MEAATIARYLPGLGDPLCLPMDEFAEYQDRAFRLLEMESGRMTE